MKNMYEISIKSLVEFLLRYGDIVKGGSLNAQSSSERAQYGAQIHRMLQKEFSLKQDYVKEAYLTHTIIKDNITLKLQGRADGYFYADGILNVDEIKTVETDLSEYDKCDLVHLAQAMCYAFLLALPEKNEACINIIYYNIIENERKTISKHFFFSELEEFFNNICESYISWIELDYNRHVSLFDQLNNLQFPFQSYREGQRKLTVASYKNIINKSNLYIQAPTGIGKTISVLFSSLKAISEENGSKIFFLTARNAGILAPQDTMRILSDKAPDLSFITLTAKEKICTNNLNCGPECPYAKGHYDRVNKAVFESLKKHKHFTRDIIENIAFEYMVCPFELSLDISLWTDVVIGDYNYLFDPNAQLKRFFSDKGDYIFLIDEAHNLQDRVRDMYTQKISNKEFSDIRKRFKVKEGHGKNVYKCADNIVKHFNNIKKSMQDKPYIVSEEPDSDLVMHLMSFCTALSDYFRKDELNDEDIVSTYFNSLFFCKLHELYDNHFCYYTLISSSDVTACIYLADPSKVIEETLKKGRSSLIFSGTLEPLNYYFKALGGSLNDKLLKVESPFPSENKLVLISTDVSTTYKRRQYYYSVVAKYIEKLACYKKGNFLVFFNSYKYITDVVSFVPEKYIKNETIIIQPNTQNPGIREKFLQDFLNNPQKVRIGLCVLGGIYSEGIDLTGDRLSGVIIVGVGMPQVCLERDIIRMVFDRNEPDSGFMNAYVYPGINKVLQAAGRVIRTEKDRGFVVLLDERFGQNGYYNLLPEDLNPKIINNVEACMNEINEFNLYKL